MSVVRGEVVRVRLDPTEGSEIRKTRPCVVVQRDAANRGGRTTIVCPLSAAAGKRPGTLVVPVPAGIGGTTKESVVMCAQVRMVDQVRVLESIGMLPPDILEQVNAGLRAVLDL